MKTIYRIARTELQTLFFSPVAWLILVVFACQASITYTDSFQNLVKWQSLKLPLNSATLSIFAGMRGLFTAVQTYLFLYIPLLTMGVMSRELGSGSIKLLYSSPLTNSQIILGKYMALVVYCLTLMALLGIFGLHAIISINSVDIPAILSGMLGLFLLACAYASIGLFMSSLTTYPVVAAMGTIGIFGILAYIKGIGQDIEFVRDITYWLAISGRVDTFISGLLTSEDLLYFILVIGLFLALSILKMQTSRQKSPRMVTFGKYAAVIGITMLIGYVSALPSWKGFYDTTATKVNTLTKSSQEVMSKLKGGVTINTYSNMLAENYYLALPIYYKIDVDRFKQYTRFKPEIKLNYYYYYHKANNQFLDKQYPALTDKQRLDTIKKVYGWDFDISSYDAIKDKVDLEPEQFRFVRTLESANGKKTFLRVYDDMLRLPSEAEITAAFKRLASDLPVVGFLTGHGERESDGPQDRGYNMIAQDKTFRYALINQGFDFTNVSLDKDIPANIRILVIAEMKKALLPEEMERLNRYIAKGGNLIIAGEPGRQEFMNPLTAPLGVQMQPGILVKPSPKHQADLLLCKPTKEALEFSQYFKTMKERRQVLVMPTAGALSFSTDKGFAVKTFFTSDSTGSWDELETTNFVDDTVLLNTAAGEIQKPYPTVIGLSRKINNKEQKILITGDADWLSNGELGMGRKEINSGNFGLVNTAFFWLSDGEVPIDMHRDPSPDTSLSIGEKGWAISNTLLKWVLPCLLIAAGLIIWIRRRGR
jgi:ABC-2 type transport system permease protein